MRNTGFSGNHPYTIDNKGRATVPVVFREQLGPNFTVGLNNDFTAIALYPKERWDKIQEQLDRIPESDRRGMTYVRLIQSYSYPNQTLDGQGRLLLPQALREKTCAQKDIRFVGVGRYLEIWDEAAFLRMRSETEAGFNDLLNYVNETYFRPDGH